MEVVYDRLFCESYGRTMGGLEEGGLKQPRQPPASAPDENGLRPLPFTGSYSFVLADGSGSGLSGAQKEIQPMHPKIFHI